MEVAIDMGLYNTPKGFTSQLNLCSASKFPISQLNLCSASKFPICSEKQEPHIISRSVC